MVVPTVISSKTTLDRSNDVLWKCPSGRSCQDKVACQIGFPQFVPLLGPFRVGLVEFLQISSECCQKVVLKFVVDLMEKNSGCGVGEACMNSAGESEAIVFQV